MVDLEISKGMFQVHPESQPRYGGKGLMERVEDEYKFPAPSNESILKQINDSLNKAQLEIIKDIKVDNNEVVNVQFYGDIMENININEQDQYIQLMNTFLNRSDKRKLKRYKGFKSFTDRIYGL